MLKPTKVAPSSKEFPRLKVALATFVKLRTFVGECRRVLTVTKKPTKFELTTIVKVSGIGILLIGLIGFVLHLFNKLVFQ